jgi:protein tyrosine/serine phosphatase
MKFSRRLLIALPLLALPMLASEATGIKNFAKVDDHVYRGGQPSSEGWKYLASTGIKVVIDLRAADGLAKKEEQEVTAAGMKFINVPMTGLTPPTEAQIVRILAILEDANSGPVFVHCMRGADRTGAVIAAYHINHDKWDNERALKDAKAHHMSFFEIPRQGFIRSFRPLTVVAGTNPGPVAIATPATPAGAVAEPVRN